MAFWIASSPHNHAQSKTSALMRVVIYATIPAIITQWYFFGWGNLIHIMLAILIALAAEFTVLSMRHKPVTVQLFDGSAILTAILIGVSVPALAPWWITVIGTIFAIAIVKQLYGGLGHNPFNPAMAAYVMLLVSFPMQMTLWQPPIELMAVNLDFINTLTVIFTDFSQEGYSVSQLRTHADGFTMATPLDTVKTSLTTGNTIEESLKNIIFIDGLGIGWFWLNVAFLVGGIFLMIKKAIPWVLPASFLGSIFVFTLIAFLISPDHNASTLFHWFSGATMIGAFFILTDPVTCATSTKGRIVYGAVAGLLVCLIRKFGGYPDAVAFAVLLCNMAAPLIDQYTRPRTYGH